MILWSLQTEDFMKRRNQIQNMGEEATSNLYVDAILARNPEGFLDFQPAVLQLPLDGGTLFEVVQSVAIADVRTETTTNKSTNNTPPGNVLFLFSFFTFDDYVGGVMFLQERISVGQNQRDVPMSCLLPLPNCTG